LQQYIADQGVGRGASQETALRQANYSHEKPYQQKQMLQYATKKKLMPTPCQRMLLVVN